MDRNTLVQTFLDDTGALIERLNNTLVHLEKDPANLNLVHQAFRFVHSIKSESSYLQIDSVTKASHNLETLLDIIRRDKRSVETEDMKNLYECVDDLENTFRTLEEHPEKTPEEESEGGTAEVDAEGAVSIGELERALLLEARERGEKLYRLSCEIEDSAPMKKSRAFLLVNNLELVVNVVSVEPPLDEEQDERFRFCTVIFTSDTGEAAVRDAVWVDQIRRVQITGLDYDSFLKGDARIEEPREKPAGRQEGFYRVPAGTLDEVLEYMDQIKLRILRLGGEGKELSGIRNLAESLEALLKDLRKVRLASYFSGFGRLVRDLADGLGKKVELDMNIGDISLDRNSAELLSDVLVHIIRNAVDHGIETPEERIESGKPEYGTIELSADLEDGSITVIVKDDGRGIDADHVRETARSKGLLEDPDSAGLLDILALPGFSTRDEATDYSGRGVGLDVILGRLEKTEGGRLELETRAGDGCTFSVTVPLVYKLIGILLVRCGAETLAVPLKNILGRFPVEPSLYQADEKGFLLYGEDPVYSTGGRIFAADSFPDEKYGILLQHLGSRGVILVDELLFEKEIPEESLVLNREIRPHIFNLAEGNAGYLFLNPSLISQGL